MSRLVCLVLCSVVLVGCDTTTTQPLERVWQGQLEGEPGWEHLSGETAVHFVEGTASFIAAAQIAGDEPGEIRPWHVHFNTCAEGGGIVGEDGDYPRLVVDTDGTAVASATVPQSVEPGADYHVNVHLSEAEMGTIIMCADLELVF